MKKLLFLFAVLLASVGAWAITYPTEGVMYTIKNVHGFVNNDNGYKHYMAANAGRTEVVGVAESAISYRAKWFFEKVSGDELDNSFYLKNAFTGMYAYIANPTANQLNVTLSFENKTPFYLFEGSMGNGSIFIGTQNSTSSTWGIHGNGSMDTWEGSGDGNQWLIEESTVTNAADADYVTSQKSIIKTAPGYPKKTTQAYLDLYHMPQGLLTEAEIDALVTSYKTCADIILPEDGKAYTFTSVMGDAANATRYYMKYVNGQKVSVSTASAEASVFVCKELSSVNANEKKFAFVTADGHILTWVGNDEGNAYKENDNIHGYSSNFATEYNGKSDWNEITVKKNGTEAKDFGYLRLVARRNSSGTSSIIANKNNRFDQSGDSYYFNGDNSSAWILTEVEYTNTSEQNLALAKIDAKEYVKPYAGKVGNGIGYAYYLVGGQEQYTDVNAAIDAATTVEAVNAIRDSFKFKVPQTGVLYALYDATNSVYLDIHNLGADDQAPSYNQLATMNADKQYLYITGNETNGTWKIHSTPEGGNYLHKNSTKAWDSWVSSEGADFNWEIEVAGTGEEITYSLKTSNSEGNNHVGSTTRQAGQELYVDVAHANALVFKLVEATPEEDLAYTKNIVKLSLTEYTAKLKNQPGYYYCTINGEKVYDAVTVNNLIDAAETKEAIAKIVDVVKAPSVVLPEPGKAYKMAFKPKSGDLIHITASGTSLSTGTEGSVFYCVQGPSADYPYVFVSAEGNFLSYKVGNDGTIEDALTTAYTSEVNDVKVGAMVGVNSNVDDNTIDLRFGTVYVKTDKRPGSNNDDDGCLVYKTKSDDIRYDGAKEPFFKDDFTSAIVMTEVEAEGNEAVAAAILSVIKVNAKAHVTANASKLGEGIGYAYYMAGETKLYTADEVNAAIDEAATIEDVNAITNSFKYEVPKAGTPYYLFDAAHNVYVDIHNLGAEENHPTVNQMATLNNEPQPLYITADPADGSWKIHTTLRGGAYLCQYTGGRQTWDSWVSADAANFSWEVEVRVVDEKLYYVLKNTGSEGGYLGREDHSNGKVLYANQTDEGNKLNLQLIEVPEEIPSVKVYSPTTRATALENGKMYMIYNTTFNDTEDRTGFLYDNGAGIGHTGSPKKKPYGDNKFKTISEAYLWEVVTTDEEGKYYLKLADGGYVNATGKTDNAEPQVLYIQPWNTSTTTKAGVKSEDADGTVIENANIGADVFTIGGTKVGNTGQDCWNGNPDTWAKWESAHPYAFYEVEEKEVTFEEGFPIHGRTYYIYCDNDTRQYFYNDGGTLKVSEKRTEWSNEYLFTCSFDGLYFQFKNMKGKYLAHKTLSDNAHNFELASYLGGVNLKTPGGSYFVMKADGGFDQSSEGQYDPASTNFSTVYKFEEFNFPVDGEVYYIYADTYQDGAYVNRFLYADGGNLKLNTSLSLGSAYQWTCKVTDDGKVQFQNGAGKYLAHRGIQDTPYNFTLNKGNANHAIAATLFSNEANRYFVVKNDGTSFDQADRTYNQTTESHCTDFVFMSVSDVKVLSVNPNYKVTATATWNGETKSLPASWTISPNTIINDPMLSIDCREGFEFVGLYDGEESLGETVDVTTLLDKSRTLTAKFNLAFFSQQVGDKWINIVRKANAKHAMFLGSAEADAKPTFNTKDYANVGMMWSFVGTADEFKIYNYVSGNELALTPSAASIVDGTEVKMVAADDAQSWHLIVKEGGYAIAPVSNNDKGLNSYGGDGSLGGNIKFYGTGDNGTQWSFDLIDTENLLTMGVSVDQVWTSSPRVAELTFNVDGNEAQTRITQKVDAAKYYLPKGAVFSLASMTYRGYDFNGFNGEETYESTTIPVGGLEITASYTANDERTLFYTPRDGHPYRIPAIATAPNGDIFAICDYRPCGADIGNGDVDIVVRISKDNGETWGEEFKIADGDGGSTNRMETGYGDPAIVVDRESNKILVMMVAGRTVCGNSRWDASKIGVKDAAAVNRAARIYGTLNESTGEWEWTQPEEVTDDIYKLFLDESNNATVTSYFIGSGKICQSRVVKKGEYYRLYCALWTRDQGNRVIYSDDFGGTWNVLGTINDRPASNGNEPKCEELPDGTVVLSSRVGGGRYFNLFTFADDTYTTGTWGEVANSTTARDGSSQGTNGEIYKVKAIRKEDGKICDVMLQSIPAGPGRSNVTVWYKEMDYTTAYTPAEFAADWKVGKQLSQKGSAYSTMHLQADGRIGFFFEEEPGEYCMVYIPYTIEDVTGGAYSLYTVNSTIGEYKIGTFYASEAMQIPDGIKAYVATEKPKMNDGVGVITMEELEGIIPANTGAVLRGEAENYEFIPSISYGTPVENNMLVGYEATDNKLETTGSVTLPNTEDFTTYILTVNQKSNKVGFYRKDKDFNVGNNKSYLVVPTSAAPSARAIYFSFDDDTETGIWETENGEVKTENCYDLSGRRVEKLQKGVYIVNGKKILK